jgi:hypothetical protein
MTEKQPIKSVNNERQMDQELKLKKCITTTLRSDQIAPASYSSRHSQHSE